jgi:type 1 glutamine amidotransferase
MRKALIVWGGWEGHEPETCAGIVREMLVNENFEVSTETSTERFADSDLGQFDLIVPIYTMGTIEETESKQLCATIQAGTGLAGYHGGMGDSFRSDTNYQFMTGGQWVAHPGDIIDYSVNIVKPNDPIMEGIKDFGYRSEQYYMHVDPSNEVLATTTFNGNYCSWIDRVEMPVVWKRRYGLGRVFYSSLGHVAAEFNVPEMAAILRRGMLWAARDESS